ncbi:MAG: hypothetical protein EOM73_07450 [Bacteroidia bacterium]|nr:hypothetical protein [Bacteroidia bacterium]
MLKKIHYIILLVLFLTVSAWGFLEILVSVEPRKRYYWMAYLGAALAFETKGFPAAVYAGVSVLFLLFNPWKTKKLKQILEPFSVSVAIIVALSWFVVMYFEHGSAYFSSFFADQVGNRVSSKSAQVIKNLLLGLVTLIAFLIPWVLMAISKSKNLKKHIAKPSLQNKAVFAFILIWIVLTILMSGAVFKFYDRYVLPVIPLAAFLLAHIFTETGSRWGRLFLNIFLGLNLFVLAVNFSYAAFIVPDFILILGTLMGCAFVVAWFFGAFKTVSMEIRISGGIMFLFFNGFILLYPLLMPNPGQQLVDNLNRAGISATDKVYVYGNIRTASNIRIHSQNHFDVVSMDTVFSMPAGSEHFLVFDTREQDRLDLSGYQILEGSEEWLRVPVAKFPALLAEPVNKIKENGIKYRIAKPITKK